MSFIKRLSKKLLRYFIQGLILVVPVSATLFIIFRSLQFIDGILPVQFPGLGILTLVSSITLLGALGSSFLFQPVINYFDKLLERAPLIKVIYSSIKDLLSAFVGKEKKFNQPVLVKLNTADQVMRLGFVTQNSLEHIGMEKKMMAVYFPHSYNFSGNLYIVPSELITALKGPSADIMKFVVSGGVTDIDEISIKK